MEKLIENIFAVSSLHLNSDVPAHYKKLNLHIALEKADLKKDWQTFKTLFKLSPDVLMKHLEMTGDIFNYNYKKLSKEKQKELFN